MSAARPSRLGWLALIPLGVFVAALAAAILHGVPMRWVVPWVPALDVDLKLLVDGWSLLFVLLITGIGAFVFVYAAGYMADESGRGRLFGLLLAFLVAMLGCVTADNVVTLFVFWELTSLTSFLLVGFKHADPASRRSAQQALMVTGGGGLVLLAGLILLAEIAGTYSISTLVRSADAWRADPRVPWALGCVFVGAFTKSAQFPFHFWLPNAMSAPTPVSAWLHSATMVKLGVYLLGRLQPAFYDYPMWQSVLITVGGFTSAYAMLLTLRERDLKRILAWSTVSALGTLVMLLGLPGPGAAVAATTFVLAHALYKAPLFFVAGNVDHATGTRSIDDLTGLARVMPFTAAAAALAAISMAGMPLSFGFVAKDLVGAAKYAADEYAWLPLASVFVSAVSVAVAAVAAVRVFWNVGSGRRKPWPGLHDEGPALWLPPLAVASLGVLFGLMPQLLDPLLAVAAPATYPRFVFDGLTSGADDDGSTWSALVTAIGVGVVFYVAWDRLHRLLGRLTWTDRFGPEAWYGAVLVGIPRLAGALTRRLQHGGLGGYVGLLLVFALAVLAVALWGGGPRAWPAAELPSAAVAGAALALVVTAIAVCLVRDAFVLLLVAGLVGLGCALLFLFLGAPDVAFTQFAVEVVFVVVIAAVLLRVRRLELTPVGETAVLPRALLALGTGAVVAALLLTAVAVPFDATLPQWFGERAVPDAHGRNVVNVILVDFRAFDTLGEIAVVAAAFLAAVPLLRGIRARVRAGALPGDARGDPPVSGAPAPGRAAQERVP